MQADNNTINFLFNKFRSYYEKKFVDSVKEIERREFGIGAFGKKITERHLAFDSSRQFNEFLREEAPFYVSCSAAYYQFPDKRPMETKNYLKSDLVYEFDADDLKTKCKEEHDSWRCIKCGAKGKGAISNCTECGASVISEQWVCNECLEETKKESFKLIELLKEDFDFEEGITVNFSGSKGYHVHVSSEKIFSLSNKARIELVDYLTANSLSLENQGFNLDSMPLQCPKQNERIGLNEKIMKWLAEIIERGEAERIAGIAGISFKAAKDFIKRKQKTLENFDKGVLSPLPKKSKAFWFSLIKQAIEEIKVNLDRQTSIDASKIIRVPDTIHGSTGLLAKSIPLEELKSFDPLKESIIFSSNPTKVFIGEAPKFCLGGEFFGPYDKREEILPEFAAVYLTARGSAAIR